MARHRVISPLKRFMLRSTGYSYPNMGRLFMRLFVGIMLLQFALRLLADYNNTSAVFPAVIGMGNEASMICMVSIEIVCSLFIMVGLFTRIMCLPPFIAMVVAEIYVRTHQIVVNDLMPWQQQNYLPVMFMGIFFFLFLVGPGKISADYMLSLRIIHTENRDEDEELEIV
ncbi:MAG: DoxX family protein [Muribaculaceae bacterium]|nr:DoxX family protein [Muribaculaceae bacterium]